MIPSLAHATLASLALAIGVWLAMTGAVTATTAGEVEADADRRHYRRTGIAMAIGGLLLFVIGAIAGLEIMA
jgi:uncharacterized membrane protein (DUF4010 family)